MQHALLFNIHHTGTLQELVAMILSFLEAVTAPVPAPVSAAGAAPAGQDREGVSSSASLRSQTSLLLCTMKLLLYHKTARECFHRLDGYKVLGSLVKLIVAEVGLNDFSDSDRRRKEGGQRVNSLDTDDANDSDGCPGDVHMSVTTVLLSLLFGQLLTADGVEAHGDVTCAAAVRCDLLVKNSHALHLLVQLVESSRTQDVAVGLSALECMLRLSPLSIIALQNSGGVVAVGRVVARKSLVVALLCDERRDPLSPPDNTADFTILQCASNILVKVAVLNAEVDVEVLAFLTCILRENALFHHRCLSSLLSSSPTSHGSASATVTAPVQRCTNCETEAAVFECTDGSCIRDEMFALCVECDKVFHKSVLKRSHIRIPVLSVTSHTAPLLFEAMASEGGGLRAVVEEQLSATENSRSSHTAFSSARELWEGPGEETEGERAATGERHALKKELLAQASCLLLSHIKAILNDRQVGGQI